MREKTRDRAWEIAPGRREPRRRRAGGPRDALALAALAAVLGGCPDEKGGYTGAPVVCFGDSVTEGYTSTVVGFTVEGVIDRSKAYPAYLQKLVPNREVVNAGRDGDDTARGLARVASDVVAREPGVVILFLGAQDLFNGIIRGLPAAAGGDLVYLFLHPGASALTLGEITGDILPATVANLRELIDTLLADTGATVFVAGFYTRDMAASILTRATGLTGEEREACVAAYDAAFAGLAEERASERVVFIPGNAVWRGVWDGMGTMCIDTVHPTAAGYEVMAGNFYEAIREAL